MVADHGPDDDDDDDDEDDDDDNGGGGEDDEDNEDDDDDDVLTLGNFAVLTNLARGVIWIALGWVIDRCFTPKLSR